MLNQYYPTRYRIGAFGRPVGTIPVGTIAYIQDRATDRPVCRNPWIVLAWLPREYTAHHKENGRYVSVSVWGGHLALVRSLRDGRIKQVSDTYLHYAVDNGLEIV